MGRLMLLFDTIDIRYIAKMTLFPMNVYIQCSPLHYIRPLILTKKSFEMYYIYPSAASTPLIWPVFPFTKGGRTRGIPLALYIYCTIRVTKCCHLTPPLLGAIMRYLLVVNAIRKRKTTKNVNLVELFLFYFTKLLF